MLEGQKVRPAHSVGFDDRRCFSDVTSKFKENRAREKNCFSARKLGDRDYKNSRLDAENCRSWDLLFLTCPINFREKMLLINFLWSYLFETGTDRAEILHSCQTRGTEQLLPWSKRGLPLKKSEIPWFAVVLSARARARAPGPPELGASSPYPERGRGIFQMARALLFLTVHSFEIDQSKWFDASLFSLK